MTTLLQTGDRATDGGMAELAALLGPKGLIRDADILAPWLTDWRGRVTGQAAAMIAPADVDELAAAMAICHRHRLAVVPQGGNSGMSAGATPDASGTMLILSLRRIDHIGAVEADGTIIAGAGAILQNVHNAAARAGRRFPLTLGGKGSATIGGLTATNAGGTQVLRHGTMRALVRGLDVVLAGGSRANLLTALAKDNRGFDPKALFVGSEGTLGVIAAVRLATVPAIIDRAVAWVGTDSPQSATRLLYRMQAAMAGALEGFEVMPADGLDAVLRHIPGARAPLAGRASWNVLIEVVRDDPAAPEPSETLTGLLADALAAGLIADAVIAQSEAEAEALWTLRDSISEAERAEGPAVQHDISVPVARMADFIIDAGAAVEAAFPGTVARAFGHLGDGNVHFHVRAPGGMAAADFYADLAGPVSRFVHDAVVAAGGSISAEHGIGRMKRAEFARTTDPVRLALLAAVKAALDPHGLLNPGALLPGDALALGSDASALASIAAAT